jgi:hypothetical protein
MAARLAMMVAAGLSLLVLAARPRATGVVLMGWLPQL